MLFMRFIFHQVHDIVLVLKNKYMFYFYKNRLFTHEWKPWTEPPSGTCYKTCVMVFMFHTWQLKS